MTPFRRRSPPRLFTPAARRGLEPGTATRFREARLSSLVEHHLSVFVAHHCHNSFLYHSYSGSVHIYQAFFVTGAGLMVEIFDDRIEITNPGEPLVDTQRFVDTPPKSRNETLASMMRRFRICEERGSGIDKVIAQIEIYQLPAPLFEVPEGFTRVVLFAHKHLIAMDKAERVRACYLHACLKYVRKKIRRRCLATFERQ